MSNELCTVRQAADLLDTTEQEVIALADKKMISSQVKSGGYLRFDRADLLSYRKTHKRETEKVSLGEHVYDFFYYNDFYLMSFVVIAVLAAAIIFF